jgi:hypothetical protein
LIQAVIGAGGTRLGGHWLSEIKAGARRSPYKE